MLVLGELSKRLGRSGAEPVERNAGDVLRLRCGAKVPLASWTTQRGNAVCNVHVRVRRVGGSRGPCRSRVRLNGFSAARHSCVPVATPSD